MKLFKYQLLLFLIIFSGECIAQSQQVTRSKIESALLSYYNTRGSEIYSLPKYQNKAFVFGFAIYMSRQGKIDSMSFTNKTKILDSLVSFQNIEKRIKEQEKILSVNKNVILVGVALVRKANHHNIDNFYDGLNRSTNPNLADFDTYFYNMLPIISEKTDQKKIKLLAPFSLVQLEGKQ